MSVHERWCSDCQDHTFFETPPCLDGHDDCVELACVDCGGAVVGMTPFGVVLVSDLHTGAVAA